MPVALKVTTILIALLLLAGCNKIPTKPEMVNRDECLELTPEEVAYVGRIDNDRRSLGRNYAIDLSEMIHHRRMEAKFDTLLMILREMKGDAK